MLNLSRLSELEAGLSECRTLQEAVSVNMVTLLQTIYPDLTLDLTGLSWPKRMDAVGKCIYENYGLNAVPMLQTHTSDFVRGWACCLIKTANLPFEDTVSALKPLIIDANPGVREWAWMALRPQVAADPLSALSKLKAMVYDSHLSIRRFAIEVTRPRGVWTTHIPLLKNEPWHGLALLLPLKNEQERYVQNAVANWLNDAGKTQGQWVCKLLQEKNWHPYITKRALRNLRHESFL